MANLTVAAADVRLVTGNDEHQMTAPAGEAIAAGQYCRLDPSTGKFVLGNATAAGEVGFGFIALNSAAIGETLTGLRGPCLLDIGEAMASMNWADPVYLSDTDGTLADSAGTVSTILGYVVPGWAHTTADKLLRLALS